MIITILSEYIYLNSHTPESLCLEVCFHKMVLLWNCLFQWQEESTQFLTLTKSEWLDIHSCGLLFFSVYATDNILKDPVCFFFYSHFSSNVYIFVFFRSGFFSKSILFTHEYTKWYNLYSFCFNVLHWLVITFHCYLLIVLCSIFHESASLKNLIFAWLECKNFTIEILNTFVIIAWTDIEILFGFISVPLCKKIIFRTWRPYKNNSYENRFTLFRNLLWICVFVYIIFICFRFCIFMII